jgi:hypothetical protein
MIVRKVMLLGEMAVGKTSIANRLAFDRFGESYKSTIGTDIYVYDVEAPPGDKPFRFLIWDTDGSFEDAMFRSRYMRGVHAASSSAILRVAKRSRASSAWPRSSPRNFRAGISRPSSTRTTSAMRFQRTTTGFPRDCTGLSSPSSRPARNQATTSGRRSRTRPRQLHAVIFDDASGGEGGRAP